MTMANATHNALGRNERPPWSEHMKQENIVVGELLEADEGAVLKAWLEEVNAAIGSAAGTVQLLSADAGRLLEALRAGLRAGADGSSLDGNAWQPLREALEDASKSGVARGVS